jgi:S1-C subfamily serine protease
MAVAMLAAGLVLGSLVGGATGAAVASRTSGNQANAASGTPIIATTNAAAPAAQPGSVAAIYQQDAPGVVTISTTTGGGLRNFGQGTGSGIVVDQQGDILTNDHVVSGANQIQVTFSDGHTVSGRVLGTDASADLAVVKVSVAAAQLHPLTLGNSDTVQIGDTALAIGAPFGLSGTLTEGIISGLHRSSQAPSGRVLTGLIQTDAAINPGNSGGALLDGHGAVIGVNESIDSPIQGNVGVGFAVPINTAKRLLQPLESGQSIQHPWLGIEGEDLSGAVASSLGIHQQSGVLVTNVIAGGPAQRAGLQSQGQAAAGDDIITAIDGQPVASVDDLTGYLDTKNVGDQVKLTVIRGSQTITITVTLGAFQAQ